MGNGGSFPRVLATSSMETRACRRRRLAAVACPICLEPAPLSRPGECYHMFHLPCLLQWAAIENSCPVCREVRTRTNPRALTRTNPRAHVPVWLSFLIMCSQVQVSWKWRTWYRIPTRPD